MTELTAEFQSFLIILFPCSHLFLYSPAFVVSSVIQHPVIPLLQMSLLQRHLIVSPLRHHKNARAFVIASFIFFTSSNFALEVPHH